MSTFRMDLYPIKPQEYMKLMIVVSMPGIQKQNQTECNIEF